MKYLVAIMAIFLIQLNAQSQNDRHLKQAIVKIYTVSKVPNYAEPWNSSTQSSSGSGAVISGNRILTNAHVIANQTFIEVQRYGERKRYIAKVLSVSHQADMALLTVDDRSFFDGVKPLELGTLPKIEQQITVYGFPLGGNTLSATTGVVSRIEHTQYVHSGESFLAVQVDAAVNPGNSGGPAISEGKLVGIVMQGISKSQSIGYIVPVDLIRHFLVDMEDGHYDGFAEFGLTTQYMENPALKQYYKLDENTTGVLVANVVYNSALKGIIKEGDIITAIDGHDIKDDGTVAFREDEYTAYQYYSDLKQMGQSVTFDIVRDQKQLKIDVNLTHVADDVLLVKTTEYDVMPRYFVYGGYVFSPLSRNLLALNSGNVALRYYATQWPSKEKKEVVVLLKVLASEISRGNNNLAAWPVDKVNGESFDTFEKFYTLIREAKGEYIVLEDSEGIRVIINRSEALANQKNILQKYNIEFDRSVDLR